MVSPAAASASASADALWRRVRRVWWVCAAVRVVQSVAVVTAFNPDEYWQSLEVAHARAFGYGYVTWEWRDDARIRSYAQVLLLELWYGLLHRCGCDTRWLVAFSPRIWQGLLAAVGDAATYVLGYRWFGARAATWSVACSVVCWFMGYCVVRTFTNSMECVFTVCALALWPYHNLPPHYVDAAGDTDAAADADARRVAERDDAMPDACSQPALALACVAAAVVFRPTSAIAFVPLVVSTVLGRARSRESYPPCIGAGVFVGQCALFGALAVAVSACVDRIGYGVWTLSAWNFVRVNSMNGGAIAKLYGTHPWHWYVTSAWPTLLSALLPVFAYALYRLYVARMRQLATAGVALVWAQRWAALCDARLTLWWCVIAFASAVYSVTNAHKEFRFILPLLPPALVYCGYALAALERDAQRERVEGACAAAQPTSAVARDDGASELRRRRTADAAAAADAAAPPAAPVAPASRRCGAGRVLRWLVCVLVASNAGAWYYLSRWHQSGPISAVDFLAARIGALPAARAVGVSVDFLMDCHSAPLYAYMHFPDPFPRPTLRTLECAPLLHPQQRAPMDAAAMAAAVAVDGEWNPHRDTTASAYRFKQNAARFVNQFYAPPNISTTPAAATATAAGTVDGVALALSGTEPLPSYVVAYRDARLPLLQPLLTAYYRTLPVASFYHAPVDETEVLVFARADQPDL